MRYELSRYTLYTHERIYSKEFKIQCVATNILFVYTCFPKYALKCILCIHRIWIHIWNKFWRWVPFSFLPPERQKCGKYQVIIFTEFWMEGSTSLSPSLPSSLFPINFIGFMLFVLLLPLFLPQDIVFFVKII